MPNAVIAVLSDRDIFSAIAGIVSLPKSHFFYLLRVRVEVNSTWSHSMTHAHTHTHTQTLGRTPLDEWSARRIDLYLTTHNSHKTEIYGTGGIRTRSSSNRAALDQRLRPRGHLDQWSSLSWLTISSPHSWTLLFSSLFSPALGAT